MYARNHTYESWNFEIEIKLPRLIGRGRLETQEKDKGQITFGYL